MFIEQITDALENVYISDGCGWDWQVRSIEDGALVVSDPHYLPDIVESLLCNHGQAMSGAHPVINELLNIWREWKDEGSPALEDDLDHRYYVGMCHMVTYDSDRCLFRVRIGIDFWCENHVFYFMELELPDYVTVNNLRKTLAKGREFLPFMFPEYSSRRIAA